MEYIQNVILYYLVFGKDVLVAYGIWLTFLLDVSFAFLTLLRLSSTLTLMFVHFHIRHSQRAIRAPDDPLRAFVVLMLREHSILQYRGPTLIAGDGCVVLLHMLFPLGLLDGSLAESTEPVHTNACQCMVVVYVDGDFVFAVIAYFVVYSLHL